VLSCAFSKLCSTLSGSSLFFQGVRGTKRLRSNAINYTTNCTQQCLLLLVQSGDWFRVTTANVLLKAHFLCRSVRTIRALKLWHFATFVLKVTPQWRVLTVTSPTFSTHKITQWLYLLQLRTKIFIEKKRVSWSNITKCATHTASNLYNIFLAHSCTCNRKINI
jgi:hypothetical protein